MKSKYTKDDYKKWIRLFLQTIRAPIVFFTEAHLVPFIQECREDRPIRILVYPREDWLSTKRFPPLSGKHFTHGTLKKIFTHLNSTKYGMRRMNLCEGQLN